MYGEIYFSILNIYPTAIPHMVIPKIDLMLHKVKTYNFYCLNYISSSQNANKVTQAALLIFSPVAGERNFSIKYLCLPKSESYDLFYK